MSETERGREDDPHTDDQKPQKFHSKKTTTRESEIIIAEEIFYNLQMLDDISLLMQHVSTEEHQLNLSHKTLCDHCKSRERIQGHDSTANTELKVCFCFHLFLPHGESFYTHTNLCLTLTWTTIHTKPLTLKLGLVILDRGSKLRPQNTWTCTLPDNWEKQTFPWLARLLLDIVAASAVHDFSAEDLPSHAQSTGSQSFNSVHMFIIFLMAIGMISTYRLKSVSETAYLPGL